MSGWVEPDALAVARTFGLGDRVESMRPVAGAWSNRVYRLTTDRGVFAVKQLLNPWRDPRWSDWLDEAWRFELAASEAAVPMPAPIPNSRDGGWRGDVMAAEGQQATAGPDADSAGATAGRDASSYPGPGNDAGLVPVRVHRWVDGVPLVAGAVTRRTARWSGQVLATLHGLVVEPVDRTLFPQPDTVTARRWPELVELARHHHAAWAGQLAQAAGTVDAMAQLAEAAADRREDEVMSHGDLDQKNIILTADAPVLCDWDVAAPVVPVRELAYVALSLAGWVRLDVARAAVDGYRDAGGSATAAHPSDLGPRFMVGLDWIAFNVERAVGLHGATMQEAAATNRLVPGLLERLPRQLDAGLRVVEVFCRR